MTQEQIFSEIKNKKSFLCIGLDTDIKKIPVHLLKYKDPVFLFNRQIIEATHDLCIAYKPNIAFYEALGSRGWRSLEKTMKVIPENIFTIADAKRGDIGNTSSLYASAFFGTLNFDAVTVAPYMGSDSVLPFLNFRKKKLAAKKASKRNRWVILLALTSNEGAKDFQYGRNKTPDGKFLYEEVLTVSRNWGNAENMMFVAGATKAAALAGIRKIVPDHFLLVPGIGTQGGSLQEVCKNGMNRKCGLIINSSRGIIYAGQGKDFAEKAREEAKKIQFEMQGFLKKTI